MTKLNLLFSEAIPNVHDHTLSVKSTKIKKRKYEKNGMRRKRKEKQPRKKKKY